jgi:succinyl-CoA synthetase beta subunit
MKRELYVSIVMDRAKGGPVFVYSPKGADTFLPFPYCWYSFIMIKYDDWWRIGGMDIEEVAKKDPAAIFTEPVSVSQGPTDAQLQRIAQNLQFSSALIPDVRILLSFHFLLHWWSIT